jgi:hypothetical protein
MIRRLFPVLLFAASACAHADESYLSMLMQGTKVGYVMTKSADSDWEGVPAVKTDTKTVFDGGLLGQALSMNISSTSWTSHSGKPIFMRFLIVSGGRRNSLEAKFSSQGADLTIKNGDQTTSKRLDLPSDGIVVEDAVAALIEGKSPVGASRVFYVLDPMTASFVRTTVKAAGKAQAVVKGISFDANLIEVSEPRAKTKVYLSDKGDFIKAEGPMGIELIPVEKEEALRSEQGDPSSADLAVVSSIKVDKPLGAIDTLISAKLKFNGAELSALPSDGHQTVTRSDGSWLVTIHPLVPDAKTSGTIAAANKAQPAWVKPDLHLPSDDKEMMNLSRKVVGGTANAVQAASRIRAYVTQTMKPDASIGVLRDAREVLSTKVGVCRDYAILTATLMRAAGIPARLVSGLVYSDGRFYYHAWVEAFDGKRWFGLDATRADGRVTAGHVKLAQGSVGEAFVFTFLDRTSINVLETKRKK